MDWHYLIFKIIPLILYFIAFGLVGIRHPQKMKATILVICLALVGYFFVSNSLYFLIFVSFLLIGLSKLINKAIDRSEVLHNYDVKNFLYSGMPTFILGLLAYFTNAPILDLLAGIALGVGISDTVSSELGSAIKGKTYCIVNFRKIKSGMNGGVSWEGSLLGFAGGLIFSVVFCYAFSIFSPGSIFAFSALFFLGNLLDSLLGATAQKRGLLNNEQVNLVSIILTMIIGFFLLGKICLI